MSIYLPSNSTPAFPQSKTLQKTIGLEGVTPVLKDQYSFTSPKGFQQFERIPFSASVAKRSKDFFRETPLRYAGYINEVGEAFSGIISEAAVKASYRLTALYALSDALDKGIKAYKNSHQDSFLGKLVEGMQNTVEAGVFQFLASYLIPAQIIKKVVHISRFFLNKTFPAMKPQIAKWTSSIAGLSLIPLIVKPIDHFCEFVIDRIIRPILVATS